MEDARDCFDVAVSAGELVSCFVYLKDVFSRADFAESASSDWFQIPSQSFSSVSAGPEQLLSQLNFVQAEH